MPLLRRLLWPVATVLIAALIGALDEMTGDDIGFFVFYFVPVALAAWYVGAEWAVVVSLLSAGVWFTSDALGGTLAASMSLSTWDSLIRLAAFLSIGWTTAQIRRLLDRERQMSADLARSLDEVRVLKGLLPVCAWCSKVRDESGDWQAFDTYIARHTDAEVSHGMCETCAEAMLEREAAG